MKCPERDSTPMVAGKVDARLKYIMESIHSMLRVADATGCPAIISRGAYIAGFVKVADSMIDRLSLIPFFVIKKPLRSGRKGLLFWPETFVLIVIRTG
jgi:hypothetical protein